MRLMNYAILLWLRRRWFIRVIQDLKSGKCEELEWGLDQIQGGQRRSRMTGVGLEVGG